MIKIILKNECVVKWKKGEWTNCKYDGKCFIISKNGQLVGIYNMDNVISIIVK